MCPFLAGAIVTHFPPIFEYSSPRLYLPFTIPQSATSNLPAWQSQTVSSTPIYTGLLSFVSAALALSRANGDIHQCCDSATWLQGCGAYPPPPVMFIWLLRSAWLWCTQMFLRGGGVCFSPPDFSLRQTLVSLSQFMKSLCSELENASPMDFFFQRQRPTWTITSDFEPGAPCQDFRFHVSFWPEKKRSLIFTCISFNKASTGLTRNKIGVVQNNFRFLATVLPFLFLRKGRFWYAAKQCLFYGELRFHGRMRPCFTSISPRVHHRGADVRSCLDYPKSFAGYGTHAIGPLII